MFWKIFYILHQLRKKAAPTMEFRSALFYKLSERYDALYQNQNVLLENRSRILILRYAAAALSIILVLSISTGVYAYNSPQVNESSPLYKIKIGMEKIEKRIARNPEKKASVALKQMQKRKQEIKVLQAENKSFEATLASFNQAQESILVETDNVTSEEIRGILVQKINKENEDIMDYLEKSRMQLPPVAPVAQKHIEILIQKQNERVERILENIKKQQEKILEKNLEKMEKIQEQIEKQQEKFKKKIEEKNSHNLPSGLNNPESSGGKKNK